MRVLIGGPRRFNELLAVIPGLSDRLLTERLRELESAGLVRRDVSSGPPISVRYQLSQSGKHLEPVVRSLSEWAERWIKH